MSGQRILGRGLVALGASVALFSTAAPAVAGGVYHEQAGLLVVELESLGAPAPWQLETQVGGHTGTGYLRWAGPDFFAQPGQGTFAVQFEIEEGGLRYLRIRNHHDHPDGTEENDVWVRLDGGPWIKTFSAQKDAWTWSTNHELSGDDKPPAEYDLAPGLHTLEFSGRSANFRMDRFHLYVPGHPRGQDPNQPESPSDGPNQAPVARVRVSPEALPADDDGQTVVTLDGTRSYDPDPGQQLSFRWAVRGAEFVEGTTPHSPLAKVRLVRAGIALPVRLTVTDDDPEGARSSRGYAVLNVLGGAGTVGGAPVAWHPLEVAFHGTPSHEGASGPNPFLDRRLDVRFEGPSGQVLWVPGFYDGDGQGGGVGDVWKVRFAADEGGLWRWRASYRKGPGVAVEADQESGSPLLFDGATGELLVLERDAEAPGFLAQGRLEHVGAHYLKFRDGGWFLKGGTDSPENFLGYDGFDDVQDMGGLGIVHRYEPHVQDWRPGDPLFVSQSSGVDSRGIIGALNYLSDEGVNSIYFLPMNLGGDGQETAPFLGYAPTNYDRTHYDVSRLHQWAQVFDHAQRSGILLHVVLAETESANENWLDDGGLGPQRKLFLRELAARFGHALALKWNLSEENDFTVPELRAIADWIRTVDPYEHPIAVHTYPNNFKDYPDLLGDTRFQATAIQYDVNYADQFTEEWRAKSAAAGHPWVIDLDENGTASEGLTDSNAGEMRKRALWDVYLSGGAMEWYAGYHSLPLGGDVRLEDFRTRQEMWRYMRIAREFMQEHLPFWEMEPADELLSGEDPGYGGGQVFAKPGEVYALYLPVASQGGTLDLKGAGGQFVARWFDPRTGQFVGKAKKLAGGGPVALGPPPGAPAQDWVALIQRPPERRR